MKEKITKQEIPLSEEQAARLKIAERLAELEDKARKRRLLPVEFDKILEEELVDLGIVKRMKRKIALELEKRGKNLVVETLQAKDEKGQPEVHYYVFNDQGKRLKRYASVEKELFDRLFWLRQTAQQAVERAKEREKERKAETGQRKEITDYFFGTVEKLIERKKFYRNKYGDALKKAVEYGIVKKIEKAEAEKVDSKYLIEFWDWPKGKRIVSFFQYSGRGELQSEVFWALKKRFQYEMTVCERGKKEREEEDIRRWVNKKMGRKYIPPSERKTEKKEPEKDWRDQLAEIQEQMKDEDRKDNKRGGKRKRKTKKTKAGGKPKNKVRGGRSGIKQKAWRELGE